MRIIRRQTRQDISPYLGLNVIRFAGQAPDGSEFLFEAPERWSTDAVAEIMKAAAWAPAEDQIQRVAEDDVPQWLWRGDAPGVERDCLEGSFARIIDRICGGICYQGWKAGYFDSDDDARCYYDELRWLITNQLYSPDPEVWRSAGLYWAYGTEYSEPESCLADWRSGAITPARADCLPLHGGLILGTDEGVDSRAGRSKLRHRLISMQERGARVAVNPGRASASSATLDQIKTGDEQSAALTLDAANPALGDYAEQIAGATLKNRAAIAGDAIFRNHIDEVINASWDLALREGDNVSAALKMSLMAARRAGLPDGILDEVLHRIELGDYVTPDDFLGPPPEDTEAQPRGFTLSLKAGDGMTIPEGATQVLLNHTDSAVLFPENAAKSGTVPSAGNIRAALAPDGLVFADDIGMSRAALNMRAFCKPEGTCDCTALEHAVELAVLTEEITFDLCVSAEPRSAKRRWDYRPINLSLSGLLPDPDNGMGLLADGTLSELAALATACAWKTSAAIADERGSFPRFSSDKKSVAGLARTCRRKARALAQSAGAGAASIRAAAIWRGLCEMPELALRHSHLTSIAAKGVVEKILDVDQPTGALTNDFAVRAGHMSQILRGWGYDERQIGEIAEHVWGRRSLRDTPGVNFTTLRRLGFTEAALANIENALLEANALEQIFTVAALGHEFCVEKLRLEPEALKDGSLDILAELGFSDAAIEAAEKIALGAGNFATAPHLSREHKVRLSGDNATGGFAALRKTLRRMASLQPFLSGGIGQPVRLPAGFGINALKDVLIFAERAGLKLLAFEPAITNASRTATEIATGPDAAAAPKLVTRIPEGVIELPGNSIQTRATGPEKEASAQSPSRDGTARSDRRSAVSVRSSADTASEQRPS